MSRYEFMNKLSESLSAYGVNDAREIITDFEQHFEDGKAAGETEDEVCIKLGDPVEIAKQYASDTDISVEDTAPKAEPVQEASGFDGNSYNSAPPPYNYTTANSGTYTNAGSDATGYNYGNVNTNHGGFEADTGKIVIMLLVDIFVLTWAIPALISLIIALYGTVFAAFGSGIGCIIGGVLMSFVDTSAWLFSTLSPISTALFGLVSLSACALLVIGSIAATKGFINLIKHIINWHSMNFVGRKVCKFKKKNDSFKEEE